MTVTFPDIERARERMDDPSVVKRTPVEYSRSLSEMTAEFPEYVSTPEIRVDVPEAEKFGIVARAVDAFSEQHEVIDVDGARVLFDGGWGLLRASNTQPVLVLRYEARTEAQLEAIRETMESWLRSQGVEP